MRELKGLSEAKSFIRLAIYAGRLQIKNGAEIYRAEDTILRICNSASNISQVEAHVLPSGIFVSFEFNNEILTVYKSVGSPETNMDNIHAVNSFSRLFVQSDMTIETGFSILDDIAADEERPPWQFPIYGGFSGGFFAILFGGNGQDFIGAFITTFIASWIMQYTSRYKLNFVVNNFIGAFSITLITLGLYALKIVHSLDAAIIGSIMILVPGLVATNAIRDIMNSDFLSGLVGLTKAVFIALGIAIGVGVVLRFMR
ncbi:threonine/serine exporter family protein [Peptoniphilus equinus]|uniref:Threonine/serine exporter family protein n=1 Tax=Peptoniphilus equinus TaxID=3016343 RepID=A0ABY7QVB7_9FIRM|nr:threonine/serine exporter family protein [Peptoniphilus equinus]WBW50721.1 threonine/serine exporter family protein [Peptoniphilus equinus]